MDELSPSARALRHRMLVAEIDRDVRESWNDEWIDDLRGLPSWRRVHHSLVRLDELVRLGFTSPEAKDALHRLAFDDAIGWAARRCLSRMEGHQPLPPPAPDDLESLSEPEWKLLTEAHYSQAAWEDAVRADPMSRATFELLSAAFAYEQPHDSVEIAARLIRRFGPAATPVLVGALEYEGSVDQVLMSLGHVGPPDRGALDRVAKWLDVEEWPVEDDDTGRAAEKGWDLPEDSWHEGRPASHRIVAARAVGRWGEHAAHLAPKLVELAEASLQRPHQADKHLFCASVLALGDIGPSARDDAWPLLTRIADERTGLGSYRTWWVASYALCGIGGDDGISKVASILSSDSEDRNFRAIAIERLGRCGERALPHLDRLSEGARAGVDPGQVKRRHRRHYDFDQDCRVATCLVALARLGTIAASTRPLVERIAERPAWFVSLDVALHARIALSYLGEDEDARSDTRTIDSEARDDEAPAHG